VSQRVRFSNAQTVTDSFVTNQVAKLTKATYEEIKTATGVDGTKRSVWNLDVSENAAIHVLATLLEEIHRKVRVICLKNETANRMLIDTFAEHAEDNSVFQNKLNIYVEIDVAAESLSSDRRKKLRINGSIDYAVFPLNESTRDEEEATPVESLFIIVKAKAKAPASESLRQCIAAIATIHKERKDASKNNKQGWGVLTSGDIWRFVHINNEGTVAVTDKYLIRSLVFGQLIENEVKVIYHVLHYVMRLAFNASPTTSPILANANVPK
jgi:DNA repair ATPase RecN